MRSTLMRAGLAGIVVIACACVRQAAAAEGDASNPASTEFRIVESITYPGTRIALDVPIGTAGGVTISGSAESGAVVEVRATGDITSDNRADVFDAVVATAYGLDIANPATAGQVVRICRSNKKIARARRSFIAAKSGQPVRVKLPARIEPGK